MTKKQFKLLLRKHLQREDNPMGTVRFSLSASLDGFIADPTDDIREVFAWMGSTMQHWLEVESDQINQVGAVIMGTEASIRLVRTGGSSRMARLPLGQ